MKRRSPWLTLAACLLLRGSSAHAEAAEKPTLSISKASKMAEAELAKRGFGIRHVITSVSLVRTAGQPAYYSAQIEPPIPAMAFRIEMDGKVSVAQFSDEHRQS
ncbi:MAG: hypothetical protein WCF18_00355 [Chthoniobacteraceae bacterium]